MDFVIGCDCAAVELKNCIASMLRDLGHTVEDVGVHDDSDPTYYPEIARKACGIIAESDYEKKGILICGTGIGMAMTANKFSNIFAAVCHDNYSAERAVLSNDANVLCMGARVIGKELAKKIVKEWVNLKFADGSSTPKVKMLRDIDWQMRHQS